MDKAPAEAVDIVDNFRGSRSALCRILSNAVEQGLSEADEDDLLPAEAKKISTGDFFA